MKDFFKAILLIGIIGVLYIQASWIDTHYRMEAIVITIDENGTTFKCANGHLFLVEDTDYEINEKVKILFNTNLTESIIDDTIEKVEKVR